MKIFLATWPELKQKQGLDRSGAPRRLISYAHLRTATGRGARQVLKEYGLLKTPSTGVGPEHHAKHHYEEEGRP
jgi:hypothetical protein